MNPRGIPINNTHIKNAGTSEKNIGAVSSDAIEPIVTLTTLNWSVFLSNNRFIRTPIKTIRIIINCQSQKLEEFNV